MGAMSCVLRLIAVYIFVCCISAHAEAKKFQLILSENEYQAADASEREAMRHFLSGVEAILPEKFKASLGDSIEIGFSDIEPDWSKRCQWNQIMGVRLGFIHGKEISIERSLLREIALGVDRKNGCGYANAYRFATAVLLHQLAVFYDQKMKISKDPRVATLLGAAELGGVFPMRRKGVEVSVRSPDISEFESAQEGFAVNFERFVLDPEFSCRRPTIARLFASRFGWDPFPRRDCKINTVVPLSQERISDSVVRFVNLDPKRLYQVHYLFASKGESAMSRWGHSMYRLVYCAPSRAEPGPDCLKDVSYHVVVSFRANVEGDVIDPIKGLGGDYPSQLYLLSMLEVMREYNTDELRDLISVPLKLTREETLEFLNRSLQLFWEYRGEYRFLSNNCATEALNLLKSVVADDGFQRQVHVVTPIGLYDELKAHGWMDDSFLQNRKFAQEQGYLFPSERDRLNRAFGSVGEDLRRSTAEQRLTRFKELSRQMQSSEKGVLASQFFILESFLVQSLEADFFKSVAELLRDDESRARLDPDGVMTKTIDRVKAIEKRLSPQSLAPSGYGIALPSDFRSNLESESSDLRAELTRLLPDLQRALEARLPERYRELLRSVENRREFAQAMKE